MKNIIKTSIAFAIAATFGAVATTAFAGDKSDDHETIEMVMKKGMKGKGSLVAKVKSGKASKEELKQLHDMFVKLAATKPEKGGLDSWKAKTAALVKATDGLLKGNAKAKGALNKAANCKACHNIHK